MPPKEADQKWIEAKIHALIEEHLNPHGWRWVFTWLRTWGLSGTIVTAFLALIAIAVSVGNVAYSRIAQDSAFQSHTTDGLGTINASIQKLSVEIDGIRAELAAEKIRQHASLPKREFQSTLPDLNSAMRTARETKARIAPQVIGGIQEKLLDTSHNTPSFWPTVGEFISYRSAIQIGSFVSTLPNCADALPTDSKVIERVTPTVAKVSPGVYENCRVTLDSEQDDSRINKILSERNPLLTFKHCLVIYRGGPVNLILSWDTRRVKVNVQGQPPTSAVVFAHNTLWFDECLFDFSLQGAPPPMGQQIAETLLAQNGNAVALPHP